MTVFFFGIVTMSTVGYGYHHPTNDGSRLFTMLVMIVGVFVIYGGINGIVVNILDSLEDKVQETENTLLLDDATNSRNIVNAYQSHRRRVIRTVAMMLILLLVAAAVFMVLEDWSFMTGLHFAVQTATTVGYGELTLKDNYSKLVIAVYIMNSTILLSFLFNNLMSAKRDYKKIEAEAFFAQQRKQLDAIGQLDKGDGVSKEVFLLAVLEQVGTLDHNKDVAPWIKKFEDIDTNKSNTVTAQELEEFSRRESIIAEKQLEQIKLMSMGLFTIVEAFPIIRTLTHQLGITQEHLEGVPDQLDGFDPKNDASCSNDAKVVPLFTPAVAPNEDAAVIDLEAPMEPSTALNKY